MIVFQNGDLLDLDMLRVMGVSVKSTSTPIGYFGTGLKYACAVLLREGCSVEIYLGSELHQLGVEEGALRGEPQKFVTLDGERLPFVLNYGRDWTPEQAFRELWSNTHDEPDPAVFACDDDQGVQPIWIEGHTTVAVRGDAIERAWNARESIVLTSEPRLALSGAELRDGESKYVFYQGMRAGELRRPSLFTWNLTSWQKLTEDRTLAYSWTTSQTCAEAWIGCEDPEIVEKILTASESYMEGDVDYAGVSGEISQTFAETAERLRSENRLGGRSRTLFGAYRDQFVSRGYRDRSVVELTTLEQQKVDSAVALLARRGVLVAGLVVQVRVEHADATGRRGDDALVVTIDYEILEETVEDVAVEILLGLAMAAGWHSARQLAHLIVTGAFPTEKQIDELPF